MIVVAIIGVLVAISIPIFTAQLRRARFATNQANARAAYAAAVAATLTEGFDRGGLYDISSGMFYDDSTDYSDLDVLIDKGQPDEWSIDDSDFKKLSETVFTNYIVVEMHEGEVTQY